MKARIKKTGEIINIADYAKVELESCDSYGNSIELGFDEVEILNDKSDDIDWELRRYEIAKEAITAIMSNDEFLDLVIEVESEKNNREIPKAVSVAAVSFADALIAELKKRR